jgi:hypothetical protein
VWSSAAARHERGQHGRGQGSSRSRGVHHAERAGDVHRGSVGEAQSERATHTDPFELTDDL